MDYFSYIGLIMYWLAYIFITFGVSVIYYKLTTIFTFFISVGFAFISFYNAFTFFRSDVFLFYLFIMISILILLCPLVLLQLRSKGKIKAKEYGSQKTQLYFTLGWSFMITGMLLIYIDKIYHSKLETLRFNWFPMIKPLLVLFPLVLIVIGFVYILKYISSSKQDKEHHHYHNPT